MPEEKKVLIVDDDVDFCDSLADILEGENLKTTTAYIGEDAVRLIESQVFDIVLLDIKMPGIDGISVLKLIKKAHPQTRVIIMTGYADVDRVKQALQEKAEKIVYKPFEVKDFIETIRSL
ncbi:MAG: response regulator [Candidatus Omnitrophota bacterium]